MQAILAELGAMARDSGDPTLEEMWGETLRERGGRRVTKSDPLGQRDSKPIVLLIDEIDALVGDTLIAVLRQLRAGYPKRPQFFPQSIVLCGVRDIRDYRIHSSRDKEIITGGSAFNIKAKSLRMGDFDQEEVQLLYGQHTQDTGQPFTQEALDLMWELTQGQPWLANALGYEVCFEMATGLERAGPSPSRW